MKLQNLTIIFLIIAIPLILVMSYYIDLQRQTLNLQVSYDTKLMTATKTAIQAFEINTVEWNSKYSKLADSKRRDILASINSFTTNLSNNMGIGGTSKEYMLNYIPALIYTLSDGYYAYYKTYNAVTMENEDGLQLYYHETATEETDKVTTEAKDGKIMYEAKTGATITKVNSYSFTTNIADAKYEYSYTLRPFVKYSAEYNNGSGWDVVVNYSLNNYIEVYGTIKGNILESNGYLVYFNSSNSKIPKLTKVNNNAITVNTSINNLQYNGTVIEPEILKEKIYIDINKDGTGEIKEYKYIYTTNDEKVYYNEEKNEFFTVNSNGYYTTLDYRSDVQYRSISIVYNIGYVKLYQALTGSNKGSWYIDVPTEDSKISGDLEAGDGIPDRELNGSDLINLGIKNIKIYEDCSAINYYVEAYAFTEFIDTKLQFIDIKDINNNENYSNQEHKVFIINSSDKDPENENSYFAIHKKEVMQQRIKEELQQVLKGYNTEAKIPELSYIDWDNLLSNVSLIAFMQGVPIGLKTYNNYAIVTSTKNNEFVSKNCINYAVEGDKYYHSQTCDKALDNKIIGYRNSEFVRKRFLQSDDKSLYYYMHSNINTASLSCYYCTVSSINYEQATGELLNKYNKAYYQAIGREKYVQ